MSELSPNTEVLLSSDLLDDDLCLENMSALAFAVLDAYMSGYGWLDSPTKKDCLHAAAALRAAADHCPSQEIREADHTTRRWICVDDLLATASELEAQ
jgi:hypothetical protein